jgi:segregation and condensation protein A
VRHCDRVESPLEAVLRRSFSVVPTNPRAFLPASPHARRILPPAGASVRRGVRMSRATDDGADGATLMAAPEAPNRFEVDLPAYSGPLDLLLALIRDEKVDIYDIPIAHIAKQFLARIRVLQLNDAAEYLELAARLLRIKAQLLLPRHGETETWEDPRAELVRRLLEYQQMREVVDILERRGDDRRSRFARAYLPESGEMVAAPLALSLGELLTAVDRILRVTREPTVHTVVARTLDVVGAISAVRALLATRRASRWSDLVAGDAEPWQILSMLLALLELAKLGELRLAQRRPFASVEIENDPPGEAA